MAGYRSAFIQSTRRLSSVLPMSTLINVTGQRLIIPVYHLVSDQTPEHIRHLYTAKSEKQFKDDLEFLLKHYRPIDLETLGKIIADGKKAPENAFILTFDDGLREFYDIVAPILIRKGIPAINFLNRDFVDNKALFFRYKASLLIEHINMLGIHLHHEGNDYNEKRINGEDIYEWMRVNSNPAYKTDKELLLSMGYDKAGELDKLATYLGLDFDAYLAKQKPYMDTAQIQKLKDQGFYFGAHSNSHPEYRFIDIETQLRETIESVEYVKDTFKTSYRTFAFPFTDFGVTKTFFEQLNAQKGKECITFGSAGLKNDTAAFHLQRIPLEMGDLSADAVLKSEYVYYMLKSLLGKNTIHRS